MKIEAFEYAIEMAETFLEKADRLKAKIAEDSTYIYTGGKDSGAVKRASMDLTRALAEMRKP